MSARRHTGRRMLAVAVAMAAIVLAAVTVPGAVSTEPVGAQAAAAPIDWETCGLAPPFEVIECGTYLAPLDHDDPAGAQIPLSVQRHPATGAPQDRIGSLFLNPGGPGADAFSLLAGVVQLMAPEVLARFDIVAFTPRGIEQPLFGFPGISCPLTNPVDELQGPPADWSAYFTAAATQAAQESTACQVALARTAAHYGTVQVAQDLDLLRRAVGDDALTYWGVSYGTRIGEVYAQQFPDRIRAMILDGNVDPRSTALTWNSERGGSFDTALGKFYEAYADVEYTTTDGTTYTGIAAVAASVEAALAAGPITVENSQTAAPIELTRDTFLPKVAPQSLLSSESSWNVMAGQIVAVADQFAGGPTAKIGEQPPTANLATVFFQVNCLDLPGRPSVADMAATAPVMETEGPVYGWFIAGELQNCSGFALPPDPVPATPPSSLPPVLLLASVYDPATPYQWSDDMTSFLPGSVRVTYEGAQHGVWNLVASPCINDAANAYVLDLIVPPDGTICPFVDPKTTPADPAIDPDVIPGL